jgi:uncharacterized membrane protein
MIRGFFFTAKVNRPKLSASSNHWRRPKFVLFICLTVVRKKQQTHNAGRHETCSPMNATIRIFALCALMMNGCMAGFFYAWSVSGLGGLDLLDAKSAIHAMRMINADIRQLLFMLTFAGTPIVTGFTFILVIARRDFLPAFFIFVAIMLYLAGAILVTAKYNLPLNHAIDTVDLPALTTSEAAAIWENFVDRWSYWNWVRTASSLGALLCCAFALLFMSPSHRAHRLFWTSR